MKRILLLLTLLASVSASADFGVGALVSAQQDTWESSGPNLSSLKAAKMSNRYGVLLWIPLIPTLSFRTGYLIENQEIEAQYVGLSPSTTTIGNHVIPADFQLSIPGTSLYAFGGALLVENDKTDPSSGYKTLSDLRLNLGAGYDLISFGVGDLSIEAEYQKGTKNISPSPGYDLKVSALSGNLVFKVGF